MNHNQKAEDILEKVGWHNELCMSKCGCLNAISEALSEAHAQGRNLGLEEAAKVAQEITLCGDYQTAVTIRDNIDQQIRSKKEK